MRKFDELYNKIISEMNNNINQIESEYFTAPFELNGKLIFLKVYFTPDMFPHNNNYLTTEGNYIVNAISIFQTEEDLQNNINQIKCNNLIENPQVLNIIKNYFEQLSNYDNEG